VGADNGLTSGEARKETEYRLTAQYYSNGKVKERALGGKLLSGSS